MNFYESSLQKRLWLFCANSKISTFIVLILGSFPQRIILKSILYYYFQQQFSYNYYPDIYAGRALLYAVLTSMSMVLSVLFSYQYFYRWFNASIGFNFSFSFISQDCVTAVILLLISTYIFNMFFNEFARGKGDSIFLFEKLDYSSNWHYKYLTCIPLVSSLGQFYYHFWTDELIGMYFRGTSVSSFTGISLQTPSQFAAIHRSSIFGQLKWVLLQCLATSAVASLVSLLLLWSLLFDLRERLAASLLLALSGFWTSLSLSLLLWWLRCSYFLLVIAHPIDFSSPSSSKNESILIEALSMGLGQVGGQGRSPGQEHQGSSQEGVGQGQIFSSFLDHVVAAIEVRSPKQGVPPVPDSISAAVAAAKDSLEPDWRRACSLLKAFASVLERETDWANRAPSPCVALVPLLYGISDPNLPAANLLLSQQHCRALAFQDLHRLSSSDSSRAKDRRLALFRSGIPAVVFACCAVVQAAALQVRLLRKQLDEQTSPVKPPRQATSSAASSRPARWWEALWVRATARVTVVGLLAACCCQLVLRGLSVSLSLSTSSLWMSTATAGISAAAVAACLSILSRSEEAIKAQKQSALPPPSPFPSQALTQLTSTPSMTAAAPKPLAPPSSSSSPSLLGMLGELLSGLARRLSPACRAPVPELLAQMVGHAAEAVAALLVRALPEDASGFSHRYVPCALDALLQLRLALEDYSLAVHEASFRCSLPAGAPALRHRTLPSQPHGASADTEADGLLRIRYRVQNASDLSPQLQSLLVVTRASIDKVVRAYSDVLAANYVYSEKNRASFSSPAVANAIREALNSFSS